MDNSGPPYSPPIYRKYGMLEELSITTANRMADKSKSSAQVETSVRQQVVIQKSGGLKPGEPKEFRISVRFSKSEREILVGHAEKNGLTVSDHIRIASLGPTYAYAIDPERHQLLKQVKVELCRQGNNLNQIAKSMNADPASIKDGDFALNIMTRSLVAAHFALGRALTEGMTYE